LGSSTQSNQQLLLRSLEDLLDAERRWRKNAEERANALLEVLVRLAYDLGLGDAIEEARRADPKALETWRASEWAALFRQVVGRTRAGWGKDGDGDDKATALQAALQAKEREIEQLRQEIERLKRDLAHARAMQQPQAGKDTPPQAGKDEAFLTPPVDGPTSQPIAIDAMVQALSAVDWKAIRVPEVYHRLARAGGVRWKRGLMIIFLIARFGVNARMELALALAKANDKTLDKVSLDKARAWVRKAGAYMVQAGLLTTQTLKVSTVNSSLSVYRLTDEGRALAQRLGWEPVESEWERLMRLHEGERYEAHTMAVLATAMHARLRGWRATVMPQGSTQTPPDLLIERDKERLFVEVELSEKENAAKWRNNARENGGFVALVAANEERRHILVNDCKRLGLPGKATDLAAFITLPLDEITPETPFWIEEWSA